MNNRIVAGAYTAKAQLFMNVVFDGYDSDDDDDHPRLADREDVVRIRGYIENVIPHLTATQF